MKIFYVYLLLQTIILGNLPAQKVVNNCTIVFDIRVMDSTASANVISNVSKAVQTSYICNDKSRNDYVAPDYKETTIYKSGSDTISVFKEYGKGKYVSFIETTKFGKKVKMYGGIKFVSTRETKKILGYECKMVLVQYPDGTSYTAFYTPMIQPSNKGYEKQFKDLPGTVLEYEANLEQQNTRVKYTAVWIDLSPVKPSTFEMPVDDYKIL